MTPVVSAALTEVGVIKAVASSLCGVWSPLTRRMAGLSVDTAAPVEGFIGFAIGRSIWWDALKGFLSGDLEREAAAEQVCEKYLRFVQIYDDAESGARV